MFLMLSVDDLLDEILKRSYQSAVYEQVAKVTGRSTRQVSDYFQKKKFPLGSELKINRWLNESGINFPDDPPHGADSAVSWMVLADTIQKSSPTFLPKTFRLIHELAEKDVALLRSRKKSAPEDYLILYKEYLKNEVAPFSCDNLEDSIVQFDNVETLDELHRLLPGLLLENILHLLAHAEAEYILAYFQDHRSVLAKCIPSERDASTSPSIHFFTKWMKALNLERKGILDEMLGHYGESGLSSEKDDSLDEESISRAAMEKQIQRFLNEGKNPPTLATVDKWAKGLYWRASEIQCRDEGHEKYSDAIKDIYSGVLILDKLFKEGQRFFNQKDLLQIMSNYQNRFDRHMSAMKKEVDTASTSP